MSKYKIYRSYEKLLVKRLIQLLLLEICQDFLECFINVFLTYFFYFPHKTSKIKLILFSILKSLIIFAVQFENTAMFAYGL